MKVTTEIITPDFATDILENHNPRNRNVTEATVQSYASDMKAGRWVLNHQGIAFDVEGNLIDGQHRLWAVLLSGVPVEMMVSRGFPVMENKNGVELCTMDTIDVGRRRGTGQQMQLSHGISNGCQTAGACSGIIGLVCPNVASKRISMAQSMIVYEIYKNDIESILGCLEPRKRVRHITAPLVMYHHGEGEKARAFCQQMTSLDNMSTPVKAYVKFLEQGHTKADIFRSMRMLCQCILAFHEGRTLNRIVDASNGREFIVGMYPSLSKRIRESFKTFEKVKINKRKVEADV